MKCPNCGYELEKPNLKNCPVCGHKLKRAKVVPPPVVTPDSSEKSSVDADIKASELKQGVEQSEKIGVPTPKMVECPVCHKLIPEDSNFCPRCGCDMRENEQNIPKEEEEPEHSSRSEYSVSLEPLPIVNEPEPPIDTDDYSEEEEQLDDYVPENVRDENLDQYITNGSYRPYSGEEEPQEKTIPSQEVQPSFSWGSIIFTAILGILCGALLYYLFP